MQPRDFSLYGAVDLGARQAAAQRRQQAASRSAQDGAGPAPSSGGGFVIEVTDESFNTDVVARSRTTPVIMDLWAEWCGPCKQLGPILEKLATEAAGQWILAKVDVDANPQLSALLQVQSIPMVVAVIGGQLVPGFLGALPEAQVRQFIAEVMGVAVQLGLPVAEGQAPAAGEAEAEAGPPAASQNTPGASGASGGPGMPGPGPGPGPVPAAYAEAQAAMERGDFDAAAAAFERELASSPGDQVAKTGLAQVNLIRRIDSYDEPKARRDAAERPSDVDAQVKVADLDMAGGRVEEAFDRLLGVIRRTSGEERDRARVHLVGLFEVFPPREPRVSKARTTLSSLLF